ncbi:MAG: hypothetical protein AAF960_26845 [Bacteroidota bacterium]
MRSIWIICWLCCFTAKGEAQNCWRFGLQSGLTATTFTTDVTIFNTFTTSLPAPISFDYDPTVNFHLGAWLERPVGERLALRWEVQRSPGGAMSFDAAEQRKQRYKFFYLSSPMVLQIAPNRSRRIQLEGGVVANFFMFDYGEEIYAGDQNNFEYSYLVGLNIQLGAKWQAHVRYQSGQSAFSELESTNVQANTYNRLLALSFSRLLIEF